MDKATVLAYTDYILAILYSSKSLDEAIDEILKIRNKIQAGAWEEVLEKLIS